MIQFHPPSETVPGGILGAWILIAIPVATLLVILSVVLSFSPRLQNWFTQRFGTADEKRIAKRESRKRGGASWQRSFALRGRDRSDMAYEALDFYDIDALLTEEEKMVRDMVRDWVDKEVIPNIEDACRDGIFPDKWRVDLGEMGILGAPLKGYGCPGLSYIAYGLICQELERGDSGVRSFASVQGSLAMYPIWDFGSEEQKNHYLPRMASGELIGCFGLTEPDYGSNPGDMITRAEDKGDYYLLEWGQNVDYQWNNCRFSRCLGKVGWCNPWIYRREG